MFGKTYLKCLGNFSTYISLCDDSHVKFVNLQYLPLAPFAISYRVTDEVLIAETAVWPIFFLSY